MRSCCSDDPVNSIEMELSPVGVTSATPSAPLRFVMSSWVKGLLVLISSIVFRPLCVKSETLPEVITLPSRIMATDPQSSETSFRICVLIRRDLSLAFRAARACLTSTMPLGSRPDVGSSRIMIRGFGNSACARTTLCLIPFEKPPTF